MTICVDFDGTCVTHDFPKVGKDIGAIPVLKALFDAGHNLVLFTMRSDKENVSSEDYNIHAISGKYLTDAVNWFIDNGIALHGVNVNPTQHKWTSSPKAYGQIYIDDAALGCPLKIDESLSNRPFVDWATINAMLINLGILE